MKIKFKFLTGDMNWLDYGGKWYSQKFNNGEFDFCFVRSLFNWVDTVGEREAKGMAKYHCEVKVIAPEEFIEKDRALAFYSMDTPWEKLSWVEKVQIIEEYSGGANVFQQDGNNYKTIFKAAQKEAETCKFLFGFYMDRNQNAIGNTGWDLLKGDIGYKTKDAI